MRVRKSCKNRPSPFQTPCHVILFISLSVLKFELQFELHSFTATTTYQLWSIAISVTPSAHIIEQRPAQRPAPPCHSTTTMSL